MGLSSMIQDYCICVCVVFSGTMASHVDKQAIYQHVLSTDMSNPESMSDTGEDTSVGTELRQGNGKGMAVGDSSMSNEPKDQNFKI